MRRILTFTLAAALTLTLAAPASAQVEEGWDVTANNAVWWVETNLAVVQEARDAIMWDRAQQAFKGSVFTAALPNLAAVDNGDGTGRIEIRMPRPEADNWLADYAERGCGENPTQQEQLDCLGDAILGDIRAIHQRYKKYLRDQASPVPDSELH